jgi:two-component system, NarL family, sensor histidine kinase EvgS
MKRVCGVLITHGSAVTTALMALLFSICTMAEERPVNRAPEEEADANIRVPVEISLTGAEKAFIAKHPVIRLGLDPEFVPYEFIDKEGNISGITSEYIKLLNQRLHINMQVKKNKDWKTAVELAKHRELDVLPCIVRTREREKYFVYSKPYIVYRRVIVTRIEAPFIKDLHDVSDWTVAVEENSSNQGYIRENSTVNPAVMPSFQQCLLALANGEVDAVMANQTTALYWIKNLGLSNLKIATVLPGKNEQLHFAVRNDWPELVSIINKGLKSIDAAEEERIRSRWVQVRFDKGYNPVAVIAVIFVIVVSGGLITLVLLFWNRKLKRQIALRIAAEDARDSMFNMIVHDLKNPLMTMTVSLDVLRRAVSGDTPNRPRIELSLQLVEEAVSAISNLANSILDVANIESGKMTVDLQELSALSLLKTVATQNEMIAADAQMSLKVTEDSEDAVIRADEALLTRTLQNLMSNSIRHATPECTIQCYVRVEPRGVIIGVADDGPGIPEEFHDKIFEKFYRVKTDANRRQKSTGLGLALCKAATEAQGASIALKSSPGQGATFELCYPAHPVNALPPSGSRSTGIRPPDKDR